MKKPKMFLALCFAMGATFLHSATFAAEETRHWSYLGKHDPTHWALNDPANAACSAGRRQSPINLTHPHAAHGEHRDFSIHYEAGSVALKNNGHTIQANVNDASDTILWKKEVYRLDQFHFHTPSEHTVDGRRYPMELHLVNKSADGKIAVIGILIRQGQANKILAPVLSHLPTQEALQGPDHPEVDLAALVPVDQKAFVYSGSLTTPPCTESVSWIVLEQPITLSRGQIAAFRKIFSDNHRPLQAAHRRRVVEQ